MVCLALALVGSWVELGFIVVMCSPPSGTHRNSQSWVEWRGVREETQATWWRKRRVQREREQSSQ